jgi:polyhydroxybutyrate depolymerase
VVMMLHGSGATAPWTMAETRWALTADRHGFAVVAPEGTCADPREPPNFLSNPQVWNDGSPRSAMGRAGADDVAFIAAVLDDLPKHHPIDGSRIYLTGFSNGAGMTFRLGEELSHRFAALAPLAGYCWKPEPRPAHPRPTLYMVGAADPLVPLQGGELVTPWRQLVTRMPVHETLVRWARGLDCPEQPGAVHEANGVRIEQYGPLLTAYTIEGLGHHWPGGRGELNRRVAGPPNNRVDANEVIWEFFRDRRL